MERYVNTLEAQVVEIRKTKTGKSFVGVEYRLCHSSYIVDQEIN